MDTKIDNSLFDNYKYLSLYTTPVKPAEREIIGRDKEIMALQAAFCRPELCNVILLAEAGTGKTALVQGTMAKDTKRLYVEINLSKMISDLNNEHEMADKLKSLFTEVEDFVRITSQEVVLFMDEFHQIVQLSAAAVEVLKPLLADSGTRGIRVVAATTYEEFRKYVSDNQALVERLQRINITQPEQALTVKILRGMAEKYGVSDSLYDDTLFELIYEYTNRYIPASSQPRKSIKVLDSMVGWHRATKRPLNMNLLADVIYESEGVNVTFRADATKIKERLDARVYAQDFATSAIAERLQICVADLNDNDKPMSSFLFTGSTGTGKTELSKQLAKILFNDVRNLIRFDMTEYANEDSLERFRDELTARVWERPYSIILLDEVEKACAPVTRILLQVLDDGRLSDKNGRTVSFINSYVILTTNAASEIYKEVASYNSSDTGSADNMRRYRNLIRRSITETVGSNRFPPELLGRIDVIVPFQPLSEQTLRRIVEKQLQRISQEIRAKHRISVGFERRVVDMVVKDNGAVSSDSGGARHALATLESEVLSILATNINNYKAANPRYRGGLNYLVKIEGVLASESKTSLENKAKVVIHAVERSALRESVK